jgi:hypothetical protein
MDWFTNIDWFTVVYSTIFFIFLIWEIRNIKKDTNELIELHKYKRYFDDLCDKMEREKNNVLQTTEHLWNLELLFTINHIILAYTKVFNAILNKDFEIETSKLFEIFNKELQTGIRFINIDSLRLSNENKINFTAQLLNMLLKDVKSFIIDYDRLKTLSNGKRRGEFEIICRKFVSNNVIDIIELYEECRIK